MDAALWVDVLLWIVALALLAVGVLGLLLPALPGPPVLFAGLLLAAWIDDFAYVGWLTLGLLAILALAISVVDFAASSLGASRFGATPRGVWGALLGAIAGLALGPAGIILGPFAGAVLGELSARRTLSDATRAGAGATLGLILGAAVKLGLAFTMIGIFALARLF